MENIQEFFNEYPIIYSLIQIIGVLLLAFLAYIIVKKLLISGVHRIVQKTKTEVDDILLNEVILKRIDNR